MSKRILILGGSHFQVPAIISARSAGYYVITCDYLPDNPGHRLADESHNVSTTDLEGVLALSTRLKIDGILAYASDPAATTAAYVCEKLELPGNRYTTVRTMSNKDEYRNFLSSHGFESPRSVGGPLDAGLLTQASRLKFPVMVKPVDSSGSKGVSKVDRADGLPEALKYAAPYSRAKRLVVEEFVQKQGPQVGGEAFVASGKVAFVCLGDQRVDAACNPYVPTGMTFPSRIEPSLAKKISRELQRLVSAIGFSTGGLNLEIMLDDQERIYFMEVGPRTGGNFLPELVRHATGFDLARCSVEAALGHSLTHWLPGAIVAVPTPHAYFAIHSASVGILQSLQVNPALVNNVLAMHQFIPVGKQVQIYRGSNCTVGILLLRFDTAAEMYEKINAMPRLLAMEVRPS